MLTFSKNGSKAYILKNGSKGGYVLPMPNFKKSDLKKDSVRTILQPGELVVPLKRVKLVEKFLRNNKIHFGNFK